jgi:hypothetical protein
MNEEQTEESVREEKRDAAAVPAAEADASRVSTEEREAAGEIEPQTGRHPDNDGETVEP